MRQEQEHVAYDAATHSSIHTVDFNFDAVDEALGYIEQAPPSAREEAALLFRRLASWCFADKRPLKSSMVRLMAIFAGLRPELLDNRSGRELADELQISKQALAHQAVRFADAFQFRFARGRSKEARARMSLARIGGPNRNVTRNENSPPH